MSAAPVRFVPVVDTSRSAHARLRPISLASVTLDDAFWTPRRRINQAVTLREQYERCEETGRLHNFRRAAGLVDGDFRGRFFNDSDLYKWLEAAAWCLATNADPELMALVDDTVGLIARAQDADGYLNTYFTFERKGERWTDLAVMHELYCAGHLFQAAVAHHRATASRSLLDVAVRFADHIDGVFGPGKRLGACGHPEVEMALVELARETQESRYLRLAQFFIDQHGQQPPTIGGKIYYQDHAPLRAQREVVGHAVRALYFYAGAADIVLETGEEVLNRTLSALWDDLHQRKVYLTGGVGARYKDEAVGDAYELPNREAYAETCAAIGHVMWAWRQLSLTGEARYADAMETALYNGVLAGVSLDGKAFFYENPLADRGTHRRKPWFGTACCPPNISRMLASLPGYCYSTSSDAVWVHLYTGGSVSAELPDGRQVLVRQRTRYPWEGIVELEVLPEEQSQFTLYLRIPAWAAGATIAVNGDRLSTSVAPGTYCAVARQWASGDLVQLELPMTVRLVASHPLVSNNHGRVAIVRGPLVYCVEAADHPDYDPWSLALPAHQAWSVAWNENLLGGVVTLHCDGLVRVDCAAHGPLYQPAERVSPAYASTSLTAIPYFAWANREPGPMQVWLPTEVAARQSDGGAEA